MRQMIFPRFRVESLFLYLPDHSTKTFSLADLTMTRSRIPTQNASAIITSHGRLSPCPSSSERMNFTWVSFIIIAACNHTWLRRTEERVRCTDRGRRRKRRWDEEEAQVRARLRRWMLHSRVYTNAWTGLCK